MTLKENILTGFLFSDKFVTTIVPFVGSAVLHVTVFAAIVGFFGWGSQKAPYPEVVAIELVQAQKTAQSKGVINITDKKGAVARKKQKKKVKKPTKLAALSTPNEAEEKTHHSKKIKAAKSDDLKNQKKKVSARSALGSRQQMKGAASRSMTHGPKFSGKGLSNPRPSYPHGARSRGQQGRVVLKVKVSSLGRPVSVRVSKSSGVKSLDSSAMKAVKRWRFHPARKNGRAVAGIVYTPITFKLVN